MTVAIFASTRQQPEASALNGTECSRNVSGLIKAAESLNEYTRLVRSNTDSAARLWVAVDGKAVDVDAILMAEKLADKRAEARRILGL